MISRSATNNKVVLSLNVEFEKSKSRENVEQDAYQCHFDQVYVVVGKYVFMFSVKN